MSLESLKGKSHHLDIVQAGAWESPLKGGKIMALLSLNIIVNHGATLKILGDQQVTFPHAEKFNDKYIDWLIQAENASNNTLSVSIWWWTHPSEKSTDSDSVDCFEANKIPTKLFETTYTNQKTAFESECISKIS